MDIRQIRYFLAVAREGQFTKAAEMLNMAQPPLSQQIKQLEVELGVTLFKRGGRHIELTDAGQVLVIRGEQILELLGSTQRELDDLYNGEEGEISIGGVSSSDMYLLPICIQAFHRHYPKVTFQIFEGDSHRIIDMINKGLLDVGIIRTPFNLGNYRYTIKRLRGKGEPMMAVFAENWLQPSINSLNFDELRGIPLIVHRRYEGMIVDTARRYQFEAKILCKGEDTRTLIALAETGIGVVIMPKIYKIKNSQLICRPLKDASLITHTAMIWLKNSYLSAAAEHFIQLMGSMGEKAERG
ncbi:MAG TPA: LysR family transcriptional regulator [Ruminococcaceae bacterium]|nr:LysR family transcriptional regulator [Oscillospiraceae bacterium]